MIIRRRHTANFTTIGNALFEDERLEADEVGVLAFLLSRPHDWEVRRPQLAKRFRVGRDSVKRIIFNCMRCGWIIARKTRLSNGTFHTIYEVRDQPGPELQPDQVKDALSLVSSEASDDGESEAAEPIVDPGGGGASDASETGHPPTAQPEVASQLRQTRRGSFKKELPNTDSENTESTKDAGVRVFADVKALWPVEHALSLLAAEMAFVLLSPEKRSLCIDGMRPYLADCRAKSRKICDLTTYIREQRWERFAQGGGAAKPAAFEVRPGTPQWYRWRDHHEVKAPDQARLMKAWAAQGRAWWAPSEWPPGQQSTAPPLSDADLDEFANG